MLTYSGLNVLPSTEDAPAPVDLSVQMGRLCQYGGALWFPLLAHSVLTAELVWELREKEGETDRAMQTWAWALLHDAHEVATGDVPRGWKTPSFKRQQKDLDKRIQGRYGIKLSKVDIPLVEKCDQRAILVQGWVLALKNFRELQAKDIQEPTTLEVRTLWTVMSAGVADENTNAGEHSRPVRHMTTVFELIQIGDVLNARLSMQRILRSGVSGRI